MSDENKDLYVDDINLFVSFSGPTIRGYEPEPPNKEKKKIICKAMEEERIEPSGIPSEQPFQLSHVKKSSTRYFEMKFFAWFTCPKKHHRWASANARCYIDLKQQAIGYRYKQKCRKDNCVTLVNPRFPRKELEKMAKHAVSQFFERISKKKRKRKEDEEDTRLGVSSGPHDQGRCDKCKRLGMPCYNVSWNI